MRKRSLGAALFFCGLGMLLSLFWPFKGWLWRLFAAIALMILGIKWGGC